MASFTATGKLGQMETRLEWEDGQLSGPAAALVEDFATRRAAAGDLVAEPGGAWGPPGFEDPGLAAATLELIFDTVTYQDVEGMPAAEAPSDEPAGTVF